LRLRAARFGELFKRRDAGLSTGNLCRAASPVYPEGTLVRDSGAHHQLNGVVFKNFVFTAGQLCLRVAFARAQSGQALWHRTRPIRHRRALRLNLLMNVIVVYADYGKFNLRPILRHLLWLFSGR